MNRRVDNMLINMSARLLVIFLIYQTAIAQRNAPCTTPNQESAACIPARSCKVIRDALQTKNETALDFARKSQCGYETEPLVCCGSTGYPSIQPDILNIFTMAPEIADRLGNSDTKKETEAIILANFNTKELPDRSVCGLEKEKNRVLGGTVTEFGEFPWMAAVEYKSIRTDEGVGIRCGGTLINNRYVVTAAHCIQHIELEPTNVWLGEWKISADPDCIPSGAHVICAAPVQKIKIKAKIPHQFYSPKTGDNDIGLLRLEEDVNYSDYIRPICLPPYNIPIPEFGTNLTIAGWGATDTNNTSDVKLKVELPLQSNSNCKGKLDRVIVSANQLCAGGELGKDSCTGDSGGPLMRTYEDKISKQAQWYQEGVVSTGVGCGRSGFPAVYTRVSRYINWIINNIGTD